MGWIVFHIGFSAVVAATVANLLPETYPGMLAGMLAFALLVVPVFAIRSLRGASPSAEQNKRETEGLLPVDFGRRLLEVMPSALVVLSQNGRVSYANRAARTLIHGLEEGAHYSSLFRAPEFVETVGRALSGEPVEPVVFASHRWVGRWFSISLAPLPEGSDFGEGAHHLLLVDDRTEAKRSEQMRSDFIANASHELRTPLASILGYIETLQGHAREDAEAREKFLGIMQKQAGRMQRLVEDLMSLSRIEMHEHVRPETVCDLADQAKEVAAALAPLQERYEAKIVAAVGDEPLPIRADRDQLHQVLVNLIDNAMKYSRKSGEVRIERAAPDPRFPSMVGLSIIDQGSGIDADHLPRLTERFYRISAVKSRELGGTGLGLAIVKHIMNRHGGQLDIQSKPGEGSRFTIWFPIDKPSPRAESDH